MIADLRIQSPPNKQFRKLSLEQKLLKTNSELFLAEIEVAIALLRRNRIKLHTVR